MVYKGAVGVRRSIGTWSRVARTKPGTSQVASSRQAVTVAEVAGSLYVKGKDKLGILKRGITTLSWLCVLFGMHCGRRGPV